MSYNMNLENFLDLQTYKQNFKKPEESSIIMICSL